MFPHLIILTIVKHNRMVSRQVRARRIQEAIQQLQSLFHIDFATLFIVSGHKVLFCLRNVIRVYTPHLLTQLATGFFQVDFTRLIILLDL